MNEDRILTEIVEKLRSTFEVHRILLFGSRARGEATEDSDYDVLAEVESSEPFFRRQSLALEPFRNRDWGMDLLVMTPEEVKRNDAIVGSAVYWALREGRVIS